MKFILICNAFIQGLWKTVNCKVFKRKFYASLMAYICTAIYVKIGEDFVKNDEPWERNAPTIYDLDAITKEMNDSIDDINKTFHLSVDAWSRQTVRSYMDTFNYYHDALSNANGKELTLVETFARFLAFHKMSWFQQFISVFRNDVKNIMAENSR